MSRVELVWIRHGRSSWNREGRWQGHSDVELDEHGREQARCLGQRLLGARFDGVFSSDLKRARDTAELALPGAPVTVDPRLRELNFGDYEGKSYDQSDPELAAWWKDPYGLRIRGGESLQDLQARFFLWFQELEPGRYAVFTHGGVIRNALWQITGPPRAGHWTVELGNTSITEIHYGRRIRILRVNDQAHLEGTFPAEGT